MRRRRFMQMLGLGGAAAVGGLPMLARAAELQDRYFIFCYFEGGWDLLLGLDPRDPSVFRTDLRKTTRIDTGFDELPSSRRELIETSVEGMVFGPYIGALANHAEDLCVVRGMSMETLTHEVGRRRFLTGQPPAGLQAQGSSLATVIADQLGRGQAIPNLSVGVESYNDGFGTTASAIRVTSVADLIRALRVSPDALGSEEQALIDGFLSDLSDCDTTARSPHMRTALESRAAAQDLVTLGLDSRFQFDADSSEMEALRDLYGIDPDELGAPPAQAAAAVTAVTDGISRCVSIEAAGGLDTHGPEWSGSHGGDMESGFDLMAAILEDLGSREYESSGESWLSRTTVVGFSEFGRSPLLNSSLGRDHYLHNACILAGGGVRGGRVIGRTSDLGMAPVGTDLVTGEVDEAGGTIVKPEHLYRAILQDLGIEEDVAGLEVEGLSALYS